LWASSPIEGGDVADPAEIVDANVAAAFRENPFMKNGRERRALAAPGEIGRAEVVYDRHAEFCRKPGWFTDLERRFASGIVKDGLTVEPDAIDAARPLP
jgi:hypothetical protein